jgi:uncharacterized protein YbjQ (UPF0145 family)
MSETELPPDQAMPADLPKHARERLAEMRQKHFFTSDLTVNEFLLVKECGFDPLGMVMGSSIYQIKAQVPRPATSVIDPAYQGWSGELAALTQALYHARELAMTRMEEEAAALGADGIIGVQLKINLHAWGQDVAEFVALGTAVRHRGGENFRNAKGLPFTSDLTGQEFWTLLRAGYRPVGFVMGNCVYYVPPDQVWGSQGTAQNRELSRFTHGFYDARELAIERLQAEAEDLHAEGIVDVTIEEKEHSWRGSLAQSVGAYPGELIEFFVVGTAVVRMAQAAPVPVPTLVIPANE